MTSKIHAILVLWLALGLVAACGPTPDSGQNSNDNNNNVTTSCVSDADEDGICDEFEGRDALVDTDGDGEPDYLDLDSDGNGLSDSVDGAADLDGDGVGNYADLDDDGDGIFDLVEMGGDPYAPLDSDMDGTPDYQDTDSDNDTILDLHEGGGGSADSDGDGIPDYLDLDSDNDCILDEVEAGDTNPNTPPVDTDGDNYPDYRDPDSDNDGLADGMEDLNCNGVVDPGESDPRNEDTDGDGVTDMIEVAAGTDPQDPADNPQANGDFYFVVPYEEPTDPLVDTLEFRTSVQFADVYFLMDETGSMMTEFTTLSNPTTGLPSIMNQLTCANTGNPCVLDSDCGVDEVCFTQSCIQDPLVGAGCVPDLWTGVGMFNDCNTYDNLVNLQPDPAITAAAMNISSFPGASESVLQSAKCVADPTNCTSPQCGSEPSVVNPVGCPGYRPNAVRILVHITDAGDQASDPCGGISTPAQTGAALSAVDIKYVGIYGNSDAGGSPCNSAQTCTTDIAIASGTLDSNNQPFVYDAFDAAVASATAQAILELVRGVPLNVVIGAEDLPDDDGDALLFIDYLEVNLSGGPCTNVSPVADTDSDGHADSFPALLGGTPVCWDVHPVPVNDFQPATTEPQVFRARLTVYGDGSPLDARNVYFLIPPVIDGPIIPQ